MKKLILIALLFASCEVKEEKCRYTNNKGLYELNEVCLNGYSTPQITFTSIGKSVIPITSMIWHCTESRIDTTYIKIYENISH